MKPGALREQRLREAADARGLAEPPSLAQRLARLPANDNSTILDSIKASEAPRVLHDWKVWGRPTQFAPTDAHWVIWLLLCGRGWGKTMTGAQWVRERIESGEARSIGLIGPTLSDVWKTMVYGTEDAPGLVRLFPDWQDPDAIEIRRADRQIIFHAYGGAVVTIYTAEEPELRGPNLDTVWCDELAKWRYLKVLWDNLEMTLRAPGKKPPRITITTTPRPLELLKELLDDPDVRVTFGSTFANAGNLHPKFIKRMLRKYASSRLGLQELYGALLGDNPDALFHQAHIDKARWTRSENGAVTLPELVRVVVAIDPGYSEEEGHDETGIIVVGLGVDGELYVLDDITCRASPEEWSDRALKAFIRWGADAFVVERNRGGDMVAGTIRAAIARRKSKGLTAIRILEVTATRGKATRAEPLSVLYEQLRVHHVHHLPELELELTEWNPKSGRSPNRLDALVWGTWELANLGEDDPGHDDYEHTRPPRREERTTTGRAGAEREELADEPDDDDDDGGGRW